MSAPYEVNANSGDPMNDIEKLKKAANEYFAQKKYKEAEDTYTLALNQISNSNTSYDELKSVVLANRSAARIGLLMYELALSDAEESIRIQPSWIKAYYRKSAAFEGMGKYPQAIDTWENARLFCKTRDDALVIEKQLKPLQKKWTSCFFQEKYPVESEVDLLSRYALLPDKRERLSTLALFWNDSTFEERFAYFQLLINIIGGDSGMSDLANERITPDTMIDMPLHNYPDLPRERISVWCNYFQSLNIESKQLVFQAIWNKILSSDEQNDIIMDLKLLLNQTLEIPSSSDQQQIHEID